MSTARKVFLWNYHIVWIETDLFLKPFKSAWQENCFLCVYPEFRSETRTAAQLKPRLKNHGYLQCPTPSNAKYKGEDVRED